MAAGNLDINVEQGATYSQTLTWRINDALVNLTSYTARMQVREDVTSTSTIISLTETAGLTLGGAAGTIVIALSATQTADLVSGNYVYDLELASSGGVVTRLVQGDFNISPEVTR